MKSELEGIFNVVGDKLKQDGELYKDRAGQEDLFNSIAKMVNKDGNSKLISKRDVEEMLKIGIAKKELDDAIDINLDEEDNIY